MFADGEYLVIVSFGGGTWPGDYGKLVKYHAKRPNVDVKIDGEQFGSYDTYIEYLEGIEYCDQSGDKFKLGTSNTYNKVKFNMLRRATIQECKDIRKKELEILLRKEIHESQGSRS